MHAAAAYRDRHGVVGDCGCHEVEPDDGLHSRRHGAGDRRRRADPRPSLVVIAATLSQFSLPEEGLLLLLGIDTFLDMGRSATNVIGNSLVAAVVARWEGQLVADHETREMVEEMELEPV